MSAILVLTHSQALCGPRHLCKDFLGDRLTRCPPFPVFHLKASRHPKTPSLSFPHTTPLPKHLRGAPLPQPSKSHLPTGKDALQLPTAILTGVPVSLPSQLDHPPAHSSLLGDALFFTGSLFCSYQVTFLLHLFKSHSQRSSPSLFFLFLLLSIYFVF